MPRIRETSARSRHAALAEAALAWTPRDEPDARERKARAKREPRPLDAYAVKHGVRHLLALGRKDDGVARMLDLRFMAAMLGAYPTFVEPLRHWRAVGLERAGEYAQVAAALPSAESGEIP
jgi:hypothetical protein